MPNNNITASVTVEDFEETDDMGADDFAFVIGPNGELKSFMMPEHLMDDPPEEVQMISELFGIDNVHELGNRTVH